MKTFIVLILSILVLPVIALADPSVTGVTGTSTLSISGTGFGSGPNVVLFDDFESGTDGSLISTPTIGSYSGVMSGSLYSNTFKKAGSLSFHDNLADGLSNIKVALPAGTQEVFVAFDNYVPVGDPFSGEGGEGTNWKMIWLLGVLGDDGTGTSPTITYVLNSATSIHWSANNPDSAVQVPGYNTGTYLKGEWNHFGLYYKLGTSSNGAAQTIFRNSTQQTNTRWDNVTTSITTNDIRYAYINGYVRTTPDADVYFDHVYVATGSSARARVEICNMSTWSASTNCVIQTPTAWDNTSITATLRQGNLTNLSYLYVIDATGLVNATGYPVTLSGTDVMPPEVSTNVPSGRYTSTQTVTLSENETSTIKYCISKTGACTPSTIYSAPFKVLQNVALHYYCYNGTDTEGNTSTTECKTVKKQRAR